MALLLALILILRLAGGGWPWLLGGILDRHSSKTLASFLKFSNYASLLINFHVNLSVTDSKLHSGCRRSC